MSETTGDRVVDFPERGATGRVQIAAVRFEGRPYEKVAEACNSQWHEVIDTDRTATSHNMWALQGGERAHGTIQGLVDFMGGIIQKNLGTYEDFGVMVVRGGDISDENGSSIIASTGQNMREREVDELRQQLATDSNTLLEQLGSPLRLP